MKDFLHRNISIKNERYDFEVSRTRTSSGFAAITVSIGGKSFDFSNEDTQYGDDYEQAAFQLADAIDKIASNPCLLPKEKEKEK